MIVVMGDDGDSGVVKAQRMVKCCFNVFSKYTENFSLFHALKKIIILLREMKGRKE